MKLLLLIITVFVLVRVIHGISYKSIVNDYALNNINIQQTANQFYSTLVVKQPYTYSNKLAIPNSQQQPLPYPIDEDINGNIAGATSYYAIPASYAPNTTCLNVTEGRVADWNHPLYLPEKRITICVPYSSEGLIVNLVPKTLIEEKIGYQVYISDSLSNVCDGFEQINNGQCDIIIVSQATSCPTQYAEYVQNKKTVIDNGDYGTQTIPGLYINTGLLESNPDLILEYYTSYYEQASLILPLLINQTWENTFHNPTYGNLLLTDQNDNTSFACPSDAVLATFGFPAQGCVNGMYIPPQCQGNPQQDCAIIYNLSPFYQPGILQNLVKVYKLPFIVAYIYLNEYENIIVKLLNEGRNFLYFFINTETLPLIRCGGGTYDCFTRITFPTYTPLCLNGYDGSIYGTYSCDYSPTINYKLTRFDLSTRAPLVFEFIQNFHLYPAQYANISNTIGLQQSEAVDYKTPVCEWIKANEEFWISSIPEPALCTFDHDIQYNVSSCDDSTATKTIHYDWYLPKGCENGVSLPSDETTTCDSLPVASNVVFIILAIICCVVVMMTIIHILVAYLSRKYKLPIISLVPMASITYHVGLMGLLSIIFINFVQITDMTCKVKIAISLISFSLMQVSLVAQNTELFYDFKIIHITPTRLLRKILVPMGGWIACNVLLLCIDLIGRDTLINVENYNFTNGGTVVKYFCDAPSSWTLWGILSGNLILSFIIITQILPICVLIYSETDADKKEYSTKHKIQSYSIFISSIVGLIVYTVYIMFTIFANTNNYKLVYLQNITLLIGVMCIYGSYLFLSGEYYYKSQKARGKYNPTVHPLPRIGEENNETSKTIAKSSNSRNELSSIWNSPIQKYYLSLYSKLSRQSESIAFLNEVDKFIEFINKAIPTTTITITDTDLSILPPPSYRSTGTPVLNSRQVNSNNFVNNIINRKKDIEYMNKICTKYIACANENTNSTINIDEKSITDVYEIMNATHGKFGINISENMQKQICKAVNDIIKNHDQWTDHEFRNQIVGVFNTAYGEIWTVINSQISDYTRSISYEWASSMEEWASRISVWELGRKIALVEHINKTCT